MPQAIMHTGSNTSRQQAMAENGQAGSGSAESQQSHRDHHIRKVVPLHQGEYLDEGQLKSNEGCREQSNRWQELVSLHEGLAMSSRSQVCRGSLLPGKRNKDNRHQAPGNRFAFLFLHQHEHLGHERRADGNDHPAAFL
jgi:hypothetical protein